MSGHEKWYIPHDDLVSLEEAIESLETDIETLDTTIQKLLIERQETNITNTHTVTDGNTEVAIRNAILSTTKDCYIRRVIVVVEHDSANPLSNYNSDIALGVGVSGGTQAVAENVFGDSRAPAMMSVGEATKYYFYRSWFVNDCKIPANTKLLEDAYLCNIAVDTEIAIVVIYVEDVYS